jgi:hypothetical protein
LRSGLGGYGKWRGSKVASIGWPFSGNYYGGNAGYAGYGDFGGLNGIIGGLNGNFGGLNGQFGGLNGQFGRLNVLNRWAVYNYATIIIKRHHLTRGLS